jgi:hydrogenase maturation protease
MSKVLIIGFGTNVRNDDALGWRAAERLAEVFKAEPEVEILTVQQLNPEIADTVANAGFVVFIDARNDRGTPGVIHREEIVPDTTAPGAFSHHISPGTLLACARDFYGKAPKNNAVMFSITGEDFAFGETMSETVKSAMAKMLPDVVATVKAKL